MQNDAIELGYINERVKRAGEYTNLINYLVEEEQLPKKKKLKYNLFVSELRLIGFFPDRSSVNSPGDSQD